jgi:hypothetical protein
MLGANVLSLTVDAILHKLGPCAVNKESHTRDDK